MLQYLVIINSFFSHFSALQLWTAFASFVCWPRKGMKRSRMAAFRDPEPSQLVQSMGVSRTEEISVAFEYIQNVSDALKDKAGKYKEFMKVINDFRAKRINGTGVLERVMVLFDGHPELVVGFKDFLPHKASATEEECKLFLRKIKERFQGDNHARQKLTSILELLKRGNNYNYDTRLKIATHLQGHPDLLVDFTYLMCGYPTSASYAVFGRNIMFENTNSTTQTIQELQIDEGGDQDLNYMQQFYQPSKCSNRTEGLVVERGRLGRSVALTDGCTSRGTMSPTLTADGIMAEPIHKPDLSKSEQCTPSYRLLPKNYPIPSASERTEIQAEVLNDHWVSVTSGSEDYSIRQINPYENSLFQCEDDRYELDMVLEHVNVTIQHVELLLRKILDNSVKTDPFLSMKDYLTALDVRCIERLYGDYGLDMVDLIRKHAALAVPVILSRLKQKQREWRKCRHRLNKIWAEVFAKNYHKSLDHCSFSFKLHDPKSFSKKALLAEIQEISRKKWEQEDTLQAIPAWNTSLVIPDMEFKYSDLNIHEDIFQIIESSCREVCTSEELDKVMQIWKFFKEPLTGTSCIHQKNYAVKTFAPDVLDNGVSQDRGGNIMSYCQTFSSLRSADDEQLDLLVNGSNRVREDALHLHCGTQVGATSYGSLESAEMITSNRIPGIRRKGCGEPLSKCNLSHTYGAEQSHGTTPIETVSDPDNVSAESGFDNGTRHENVPSLKAGDFGGSAMSTSREMEGTIGHRAYGESVEDFKVKGGEVQFSTGAFKDGNMVVYGDAGSEDMQHQKNSITIEKHHSQPRYEEAYSLDGTENRNDNLVEETIQRSMENACKVSKDDDDIEAESQWEAQGAAEAWYINEDGTLLSLSERALMSVRPLTKYIPPVIQSNLEACQVFYGNACFYLIFRLHQKLYERLQSAKTNSSTIRNLEISKDNGPSDPYARFMIVLHRLLDGSYDNTNYENECRTIFGAQSYHLFTLDKLIYEFVKELQTIATNEIADKLLQLYAYETSRKPGRYTEKVYQDNARLVVRDENVYRLEFLSAPSRLRIQLMDFRKVRPDMKIGWQDTSIADYLYNDFPTVHLDYNIKMGVFLRRNMRKFPCEDEFSTTNHVMNGLLIANCLECRISLNEPKRTYFGEDFFYRPKGKRRSLCRNSFWNDQAMSSKAHAAKVERFHKFLSRF